MKCKQRNWKATAAVVATVTAASVLGSALPAQAVSATQTQVAHPQRVDARKVVSYRTALPAAVSRSEAPSGEIGVQSWASIIRTAINALKKVPALWKKLVDGVKKSYNTFRTKVWPALKAAVGAVSTLITAWDIWKYFN